MKTRLETRRCPDATLAAKTRQRAFTMVEMLVVIAVIAVLAAFLLPVLGRAKQSARRTECGSNLRQWALAFAYYVDDNDQYIPREGHGRDGRVQRESWASVRHLDSRDVWYNALPDELGKTPARKYASHEPEVRAEFYKNRLFHCPSARFPTYAETDNEVYFSLTMNSKLIQEPISNDRASIKVNTILRPAETVIFLDARVSDSEAKVHQLQLNTDLGQPSAFASRFAARHQMLGNLAFADGHVTPHRGSEIVETRPGNACGLAIFPGGAVYWRPDPLDDPNTLD
jgi:prepilin-type N-terminal cleavage/methylation domain-containing protein/prepilin-type processing-associated H-X9-DG protein